MKMSRFLPSITHILSGVIERYAINGGSYMSAHVLLNLLNELWKRDKMRGLPSARWAKQKWANRVRVGQNKLFEASEFICKKKI